MLHLIIISYRMGSFNKELLTVPKEKGGIMGKFIGSKGFYKKLLWLAVPIMIQNAITNFVGFLDNIMVGRLGTEQMSGVAIVNQFVFVFNLCIFGGLSGAGILAHNFMAAGIIRGFVILFGLR